MGNGRITWMVEEVSDLNIDEWRPAGWMKCGDPLTNCSLTLETKSEKYAFLKRMLRIIRNPCIVSETDIDNFKGMSDFFFIEFRAYIRWYNHRRCCNLQILSNFSVSATTLDMICSVTMPEASHCSPWGWISSWMKNTTPRRQERAGN